MSIARLPSLTGAAFFSSKRDRSENGSNVTVSNSSPVPAILPGG